MKMKGLWYMLKNMDMSHILCHYYWNTSQKYGQLPPEFVCYQTKLSTECHMIHITKYGHLLLCVPWNHTKLLQTSSCLISEQREGKNNTLVVLSAGYQKLTCWSGLSPSIYQNMLKMENNNKIWLVFILLCLGLWVRFLYVNFVHTLHSLYTTVSFQSYVQVSRIQNSWPPTDRTNRLSWDFRKKSYHYSLCNNQQQHSSLISPSITAHLWHKIILTTDFVVAPVKWSHQGGSFLSPKFCCARWLLSLPGGMNGLWPGIISETYFEL